MNWYYAESGQQRGPVSDDDFTTLVQSGKVAADTLVWHEGMANWQPYSQVVAPGGPDVTAPPVAVAAPGADEVVCAECHRIFSKNQTIQFGDAWVCAGCKPIYVQRLREGAVSAGATGELSYGGFWIRVGAKLIDGLILGVVVLVPMMIILFAGFRASAGRGPEPFMALIQIFCQLGYLLVSVGYNTFFIGKYGATPGKMACGLKAVTPEGLPLTYGRALGRASAELLSGLICDIGYIIAAFDNEKRALHDHICNTRVIRVR